MASPGRLPGRRAVSQQLWPRLVRSILRARLWLFDVKVLVSVIRWCSALVRSSSSVARRRSSSLPRRVGPSGSFAAISEVGCQCWSLCSLGGSGTDIKVVKSTGTCIPPGAVVDHSRACPAVMVVKADPAREISKIVFVAAFRATSRLRCVGVRAPSEWRRWLRSSPHRRGEACALLIDVKVLVSIIRWCSAMVALHLRLYESDPPHYLAGWGRRDRCCKLGGRLSLAEFMQYGWAPLLRVRLSASRYSRRTSSLAPGTRESLVGTQRSVAIDSFAGGTSSKALHRRARGEGGRELRVLSFASVSQNC